MIEPQYHEKADEMDHIQLEPFQKFNWKTTQSKEKWKTLDNARLAKKDVEWLSVLDDETDREAAIIHIKNENRERWLNIVSKYDFIYKEIRHVKPYGGYRPYYERTSNIDPERITYSVVAQEEDTVDKMVEAEEELRGEIKHRIVAELLGFPDKAIDFFLEKWLDEEHWDPMYEITCNSDNAEMIDGDPENLRVVDPNAGVNLLYKNLGLSFITHFPSSWDSEESIEIARHRYRIMKENGYEEEADALAEFLGLPAVWDGYHQMANIRNRHMTGGYNTSDYWSKKRIVWGKKHAPKAHL